MVASFEKIPLSAFIVEMMITIFYKQFNTDTVIQIYHHIIYGSNAHRCYQPSYYFFSILFNKIPFVIVFFNF